MSTAGNGLERGNPHQVHFRQATSILARKIGQENSGTRALILDGHIGKLVSPEQLSQQDIASLIIFSVFQIQPEDIVCKRRMSGSLHFEGTEVNLVQLAHGPGIVLKIGSAADRELQTHVLALKSDEMGAFVLPLIGSRELSFLATPYLGEDAETIRDRLKRGGFSSVDEIHHEQDEILDALVRWSAKNLVEEPPGPVISMQRIEWIPQTLPVLRASVAALETRLNVPPGRLWDAELVLRTKRGGRVQDEVYPSIGEMEREITPTVDPSDPKSRPQIMARGIDHDQSPKNWFITPDGKVKIDFGYAALETEAADVAEALAVAIKGVSLATASHIGSIQAHFEEGPDGRGRLVIDDMDITIAEQAREWQQHGISRLSYCAERLKQRMGVVSEAFWMRFATNALHEVAYIKTRVPDRIEAALFMWLQAGKAFEERDKARRTYQTTTA